MAVLSGIAVLMTVGVYGLVAGIVKLDDGGLYLSQRTGLSGFRSFQRALGRGILWLAPYLMRTLSIAGTAAMFLVGGGILTHGIKPLHHLLEQWSAQVAGWLQPIVSSLLDGVAGLLAGALVLGGVVVVKRILGAAKN